MIITLSSNHTTEYLFDDVMFGCTMKHYKTPETWGKHTWNNKKHHKLGISYTWNIYPHIGEGHLE